MQINPNTDGEKEFTIRKRYSQFYALDQAVISSSMPTILVLGVMMGMPSDPLPLQLKKKYGASTLKLAKLPGKVSGCRKHRPHRPRNPPSRMHAQVQAHARIHRPEPTRRDGPEIPNEACTAHLGLWL